MSTCRWQIADSQQWCGMKDAILHLQLPIVYLIWGLLRHCWTLRRWLEAAADCWRGPQHDGKCSFYFKCYFFHTTPTNRDLREKAVYFPPWSPRFIPLIHLIQYGFSFYDQPYILDIFARQTAHQSLCGDYLNLSSVPSISAAFQTNAIYRKVLVHPVNMWLVPIHYKYFLRNLTLHHFLLSPEASNMRVSINLTSYTLSKPDSVATFSSGIKFRNGKK